MRRIARTAVAAVVAAAGALVSVPVAASASGLIPFDFANAVTKRCIDYSFQYGLRPYGCNNGVYQKWDRTWDSPTGSWQLRNVGTGWCLDDSGAYGLRVIACNGGQYQQWYYSTYNGSLTNMRTGRCVDDSFAYGLRPYECNNGRYQMWGPFGRPPSG
jgi:hypothetical protein